MNSSISPVAVGQRRCLRHLLVGLTILSFLTSAATVAGNESNSFNLQQLIERAQRDNKNLQAARFAVDIGRARLLQAGQRENPRLDLSARSDFLFGNEGENGSTLAISQAFPVAGRIARQKDLARVDIALAEAEVAEAERRLAGEMAADVYRLLVLDRQIDSRAALIEIQTGLARTTRDRFKAAEVSELDVNTVQLDLQRLGQERELLQTQRDALLIALNTRLGRPATAVLVIDEPLPDFDALPGLGQLQARALDLRADWHAALLSADRAQAERALAKSMRWEDWSAGLELSQDKQVIVGLPPQGNDRAIGLSLSIPLPLFNKNQGRLAEADANHDQAMARIEALRLEIAGEVASTHAEASRLQAALERYDKTMLPISAGNVRLAQQGYRQGLVPVFDVVQAQRQQADLNAAYLTTLDQFLQALVRLHTAVGDYVRPTTFESGN
jgi:cobalt-zinc-cadmium efflux system outer membrane protein